MKSLFPLKNLGETCDFVRGPFGGSLKKNCFKPEGVAIYEQQHAIYNQFNEIRYFIDNRKFEEMKRFELKAGDLIMSCSGTMGKVAIVPDNIKKGIINQALLKLTPFEILDVEYLKYWMDSNDFQDSLAKVTVGAAIKNVASVKILKQIELPLPNFETQKQIVKILNQAFTAIDQAKANIENNIQNAKELFQSKFNDIFSQKGEDWEETRIGKVCDLMTGGTPSRKNKEYFDNGTINWLVSGDVNKKEIIDCEGQITELGFNNSSTRYLPINSVMIALNGQGKTRGSVAMLRIKATCNQSLVSIYPKDDTKVLPEYIYSNLNSRYNEIRKITGDSGNDRRGLNMPLIRSIKIFIPKSTEKQKEIIELQKTISAELDLLTGKYLIKLNKIEELKKSILQKAFSGELTNKMVVV